MIKTAKPKCYFEITLVKEITAHDLLKDQRYIIKTWLIAGITAMKIRQYRTT